MGCLGWKYQLFCLLVLLSSLFHLPSSFSSSLSSISPCSALLHFNSSLSLHRSASPSYYASRIQMCDNSYPKTASWKEDKDCCSWDGVVCDQTTRHVIGLDLSCSWLNGPIHSNSTLFFLPHLRTLNLAGNCFNESLISPEFGKFKTLIHLNLSYSCFSGKIPNEISHLSSLVSLDLSLNNELLIETPVWKRVIHNLTQLRELLLDWSDMSSIRPNSLMNLSSSFTTLSLYECNLQGKFQNNILCLPNLQTLDLGENWNLDLGSLPKCNWNSISLKSLDLSSISFSSKLPDFINNMKSLEHLYLANCNLTGSISTLLDNLTKLTILDLSYNNFSGLLPLSLFNLPNLSSLYLNNNQLVGPLPNHQWRQHGIVILENISFFHGPQRHRIPLFAKLVGIVAVEVIGLLPLMFRNISITFVLLNRSRPLRLTQRFGQKVQDKATPEKCPAIIKVQILYELEDGGRYAITVGGELQ